MIPNDFTHSPEKAASRAFNVDCIDESWYLAPRGSLSFDWVELAGQGAPTYDLLAPRLGPRGRFIGVDVHLETVTALWASGRPHAVWRHGRLQDLLLDEPSLFARTGVINFDTMNSWFERPLREEVRPLVQFVLQQILSRRAPHMLIIINATDMRHRQEDPVGAVLDVAREMLEPLLQYTKNEGIFVEDVFSYPCLGGAGRMHNLRLKLGGWPLG